MYKTAVYPHVNSDMLKLHIKNSKNHARDITWQYRAMWSSVMLLVGMK